MPTKGKKGLLKQAKAQLRRPNLDSIRAWLDGDERAWATLLGLDALTKLLARDEVPVDVIQELLARGYDLNKTAAADSTLPLVALVESELSVDDKRELLAVMLERGAESGLPDASSHDGRSAFDVAIGSGEWPLVTFMIERGVSETTLAHGLNVALKSFGKGSDAKVAQLEQLCARLGRLEITDRRGMAALHVAALYGSGELLTRVLSRAQDVNVPLASAVRVSLDEGSPPGGGLIPQLRFPAGLTALDLAERYHAALAAVHAAYADEDSGFSNDRRAARLTQLAEVLAALRARADVQRGDARELPEPPAFKREIDACLERLVTRAGGDPERLRRTLELIDLRGCGPWGYLSEAVTRGRAELLGDEGGELAARAADSWLGRLILGTAQRQLRATRKARYESAGYSAKLLEAADYPDEAATAIGQDLVVGGDGSAALCLWKKSSRVARVCLVTPDRFEILGEDPVDFVARQTALLLGEEEPPPTSYLEAEGDGALIRVMTSDESKKPGPSDINRVGGLPIGIDDASWPRRRGKRMHHVLTVELTHPMFREEVRAVALFLSHPMDHEAYSPRSPDARVVILTEADLAKGEPAWPEELPEDERLEAGVITFTSGDTLSRDELFKRSFVGGEPIWLQGDDTEMGFGDEDDEYGEYGEYDEYDENDDDYGDEDGDDDEDDDDGGEDEDEDEDEADEETGDEEDERPDAPSVFLLQFDENLVNVNLGDCGVMYVFAECAWFQCH